MLEPEELSVVNEPHFTIVTDNLERAMSFYRNVLRIPLSHYIENIVAIFDSKGFQFQIYQEHDKNNHHINSDSKGRIIIGFNVLQPLDGIKKSLKKQNVKIRDHIYVPIEMLFIEDYDGNEVCLTKSQRLPK